MARTSTPNFYVHLQTAADLLTTSIIVLDRFARVCWCNSAAEALMGCSRRNLKGTDVGLMLPQVRDETLLPGIQQRLKMIDKAAAVPFQMLKGALARRIQRRLRHIVIAGYCRRHATLHIGHAGKLIGAVRVHGVLRTEKIS